VDTALVTDVDLAASTVVELSEWVTVDLAASTVVELSEWVTVDAEPAPPKPDDGSIRPPHAIATIAMAPRNASRITSPS
jgi:hypothetical protein